jgi:hypothetical protein
MHGSHPMRRVEHMHIGLASKAGNELPGARRAAA